MGYRIHSLMHSCSFFISLKVNHLLEADLLPLLLFISLLLLGALLLDHCLCLPDSAGGGPDEAPVPQVGCPVLHLHHVGSSTVPDALDDPL